MNMTGAKNPKGELGGFFRAIGRFIKRHKKLLIVLVVLAIIAAILLGALGGASAAGGGMAAAPQTTTLAKTSLEQIVSGTGTLQSTATREVSSSLSYDIVEVAVKEGDKVEAGQLLARLDTTVLDKNIADVRKSISDAKAQDALALTQAERKLRDAYDNRDINWANNQNIVQEAANALDTANADLAAVNTRLTAAQEEYNQWAAEWNTANTALQDTDETDPNYAALQAALAAAQSGLEPAAATLETIRMEQATAAAAVSAAQSTYDKAVSQRDATHRTDGISIQNAQDSVDTLKIKNSTSTYQTQLDGYLEDKEDCLITAPISGTITSMTAEVGQGAGGSAAAMAGSATASAASSSALFTIEDTNSLVITTSIPEYDAVTLNAGMTATITTDAISNAEWEGTVKSISPKATDDSGNFTVEVSITSPVEGLAIGMSGKVNIVTTAKTNVFAVPYDSVTTDETGQTVVYVIERNAGLQQASAASGSLGEAGAAQRPSGRAVAVETGMETDYLIEISGEELEEGMLVLTDPEGKNVTTDARGAGGMFVSGGF